MLEENFHPRAEAFWGPIGTAVVAGLLGAGLGMAIGYAEGQREGLTSWAVLPAMVCAMLAWLYDHAVWMDIVRGSYLPALPVMAAVEAPEERDVELPPFEIKCLTNPGTFHQVDETCPLTWFQLAHFMVEVRNGSGLGFRRWVGGGEDQWSTNEAFRAWLTWMVVRGWASGGNGDEAKMTGYGKCIFDDVCDGSFRYSSPTGN